MNFIQYKGRWIHNPNAICYKSYKTYELEWKQRSKKQETQIVRLGEEKNKEKEKGTVAQLYEGQILKKSNL